MSDPLSAVPGATPSRRRFLVDSGILVLRRYEEFRSMPERRVTQGSPNSEWRALLH